MARSTQHIERDLAALEEKVTALSEELQSLYAEYLELLSQSVQKQLILASYQICTQTYPQAFLKLSLTQRQALQQNLRQTARRACENLAGVLARFEQLEDSEAASQKSLEVKILQELLAAEERAEIGEDGVEAGSVSMELTAEEESGDPREVLMELEEGEQPTEQLSSIEHLLRSAKQFEKTIHQTLQEISTEANRLLREAAILPKKLPAKLLEIAVQAEESNAATGSAPNLLNLLVEAGKKDAEKMPAALRIMAVRLRLAEIEFGNSPLTLKREKLRQLWGRGSQLRGQYEKRQQELAIARAELAWNASWFED